MNCIILLTHNFNSEFINTLEKLDRHTNAQLFDIIVLFDNKNEYNEEIENRFNRVKIIKMARIKTSYDNLGHSMYINYFRQNYNLINSYEYVWIVENDVYYRSCLIDFINRHKIYNYDLMVSEYGVRDANWCWTSGLKGFNKTRNIGVLAVILRFSQKMLRTLIDTIDTKYFGYLEAILPHICLENNLSIHQFLPELCGVLTTNTESPIIKLIESDILNKTFKIIENKIYHPIKL
jgi:hypothetical protein